MICLVGLAICLPACSSAMIGVRARFAAEMECRQSDVEVRDLTNRAFRATGCGRTAVYVSSCDGFGCFGAIIVRNSDVSASAPTPQSTSPASRQPERSDESVRRLLALAHDPIDACLSDPGPQRVEITVNELGRVSHVRALDASREVNACIATALRDVSVEDRARAPRTFTFTAHAPRASAGDEVPVAPTSDADTTLRALLDQHRAPVLACVGTPSVAIAASFTADGAVTVALRGPLAGSQEESCVQAALRTIRLDPAPGAPGSLLHAVTDE